MVFASYKRLVFLHICWKLTMASDNFNEVQIQQLEGNILRITCHITNGPQDSLPMQMSINAETPNNTLVSVAYRQCPKVQDSYKDKDIYLSECVLNAENMFLDILLTKNNPTENQQFGCNYTCMLAGGHISHSLSNATVGSAGTSSSTEIDDKMIVVHGGTYGSHDTLSLSLTALNCFFLLLLLVNKMCCQINCRRLKSPQAERKTLENRKHDNCDECTEINVAISSAEIVNDMEKYQDTYPYTQVMK